LHLGGTAAGSPRRRTSCGCCSEFIRPGLGNLAIEASLAAAVAQDYPWDDAASPRTRSGATHFNRPRSPSWKPMSIPRPLFAAAAALALAGAAHAQQPLNLGPGTLEHALHRLGDPILLADLRGAADDPDGRWLDQTREMRSAG